MENSLFRRKEPEERPPTPLEMIEPEIVHLKKGYSIRYGEKGKPKRPLWLVVLAFFAFGWLYLADPILHAWYKGDAANAYLYLHNYGTGPLMNRLAATGILSPEEIDRLEHRQGSFQDLYASPVAADAQAQTIIDYMKSVHDLHVGNYQNLSPIGRARYLLFIRTGLILPTQWNFLDPSVPD
jgi:hypothetical protein